MTKIHLQNALLSKKVRELDIPNNADSSINFKENEKELLKSIISVIYDLPKNAIQSEMFDYFKIVSMGAKKYALNNWLNPDGKKSSEKDMHDSMFHHLAESFATSLHYLNLNKDYNLNLNKQLKDGIKDHESGLDPLLHLACRALMLYTRRQREIVHISEQHSKKFDSLPPLLKPTK